MSRTVQCSHGDRPRWGVRALGLALFLLALYGLGLATEAVMIEYAQRVVPAST
jgi:hypothetical protein